MANKPAVRLTWIDCVKGICILWIAFFHYFEIRAKGRYPSVMDPSNYFPSFLAQCDPSRAFGVPGCVAESLFVAIVRVGFHAVAVFLLLSGFGLTYSLAKTGTPEGGWGRWYKNRVLRLFPMYWMAHLLYLVSPFVARYEAIDYRFLLSFLGDRIWPLDMIFYYFNPALWYFGLLLELYLVYPLLFRLLQKLGPVAFLVLCGAITFGTRYVLLCVHPVNGDYVQGAFFACRLWEFALGMALGQLYRQRPGDAERWLFAPATLVAAGGIYWIGLHCYGSLAAYTVTDAFTGTGLFVILAQFSRSLGPLRPLEAALARVGAFSYGLYLLHQPYVLYVGDITVKHLSLVPYIAVGLALVGLLAAVSMPVERFVNARVDRLLR